MKVSECQEVVPIVQSKVYISCVRFILCCVLFCCFLVCFFILYVL